MVSETRIQRAVSDLHAAFGESLRRLEDEAGDATHVLEQVEKRKELARSIDLCGRLFSVYYNIRFYPAWSQNCPDYICSSVTNITLERFQKSVDADKESLGFEYRGKRWCFVFQGKRLIFHDDADGGYDCRLGLLDSAKTLVFEGGYKRDNHAFTYNPLDIEVFVPSDWVIELVELSEEIAVTCREAYLRGERTKLEHQKQRFGLDNDSDMEELGRNVNRYAQPQPQINRSKATDNRPALIATLSAVWQKRRPSSIRCIRRGRAFLSTSNRIGSQVRKWLQSSRLLLKGFRKTE